VWHFLNESLTRTHPRLLEWINCCNHCWTDEGSALMTPAHHSVQASSCLPLGKSREGQSIEQLSSLEVACDRVRKETPSIQHWRYACWIPVRYARSKGGLRR
jgi:hypothetical protein